MANNVYKFPGRETAQELPEQARDAAPSASTRSPSKSKKVGRGLVLGAWYCVALVWPLLRWLLALDVAFRGLLMAWHWDNPESHAGWTFLLHFGVLVALTFFVSVFKPKGAK